MTDAQALAMPKAQLEKLLTAVEKLLRELPPEALIREELRADRDLIRNHLHYR